MGAALMGTLIHGLGHDHVVWGTDAIWTGSPQWRIEALRRLEIPEAMQRHHGFAPLGVADGPGQSAICGWNWVESCLYQRRASLEDDGVALAKRDHALNEPGRGNLAYGYVVGWGIVKPNVSPGSSQPTWNS